jgi:hypothetical protein
VFAGFHMVMGVDIVPARTLTLANMATVTPQPILAFTTMPQTFEYPTYHRAASWFIY